VYKCNSRVLSLALALALPAMTAHAQSPKSAPASGIAPSTWVATDALGHTTPMAADTRPARKNRFVGVFYFLTHGSAQYYYSTGHLDYSTYGDDPRVLRDNTQIIRQAGGDPLTKPQAWSQAGTYWWGEPAVGYFLADDPWVARKNLTMLAEAGVDVIIFDVTNAPTYSNAYTTVLNTAEQMRKEGDPTPQFMFITYSSTGPVADGLYDNIYAKGLWKNLWFRWQGKPLIFGDPNGSKPTATPPRPEVKNFFNWRYSWANTSGPNKNGKDEWEWIDTQDPQRYGWHDSPKVPEEVPVAVGGWSTSDLGRSFQGGEKQGGKEPPLDQYDLAADRDKGLFFSQEWHNALKIDPQFLFVTGWNEWTAGRQYGPGVPMLGQVTKTGQYYFVDEFNQEFSRDAMPMKDGHTDNYYLQLVDGIRRFKGVPHVPQAHGARTIALDSSFAQWNTVTPVFRAVVGGTVHRDWPGWGGKHYSNVTGRNDIALAKVACDAKNVYFYARTVQPLTAHTAPHWMQLLVDSDRNPATGWHGYDYAITGPVLNADTTTLRRFSDGKTWPVHYRATGSQLEIVVPRRLLGLTNTQNTAFNFHWIDNVAVGPGGGEDPSQWWYDGDSAPDGRFNFQYRNIR
jgi:hypothetical protein